MEADKQLSDLYWAIVFPKCHSRGSSNRSLGLSKTEQGASLTGVFLIASLEPLDSYLFIESAQ